MGQRLAAWWVGWVALVGVPADGPRVVRVPLDADGGLDVGVAIARLATATGTTVDAAPVAVELPTRGRSRPLAVRFLADALRPDVAVDLLDDAATFTIGPDPANEPGGAAWRRRLDDLAAKARAEVDRRARYGFRARASYRPNDPGRPTVCLLHGLNSSSLVFKHVIPPLEAAGYGVVTYDFPYNRDMDETSADFARDIVAFRRERGESARWSLLAHSMGSLLARWYVEAGPPDAPGDVAALVLIAPPNHGSSLARGQTVMQTVQALRSVRGERRVEPLASLGDGLGAAADDLAPGSAYLDALNARPRAPGVAYHILAGESAYLSLAARRQVEAQLGMTGRLGRLVAGGLAAQLDEITDGRGDGCVAVASARLDGVADFRVLPVNHLELIRAPLLFPEPGPVASLPIVLEWLKAAGDPQAAGR